MTRKDGGVLHKTGEGVLCSVVVEDRRQDKICELGAKLFQGGLTPRLNGYIHLIMALFGRPSRCPAFSTITISATSSLSLFVQPYGMVSKDLRLLSCI